MVELVLETMRRRIAARLVCALAACVLAPRFGFSTPAPEPLCPSKIRDAGSAAAAAGGFRLGTGATPFGTAAAVADFNHDQVADFTVVDRVVSREPQQRYAIEIAVSSAPPQRFVFSSRHEAVTVVVDDIDHDDDLDIVVTPALTREVLAVWVNDGFGRFTPTLRNVPARLASHDWLVPDDFHAGLLPALSPERILPCWSANAARAPDDSGSDNAVFSGLPPGAPSAVHARIEPRGPPPLVLL
jgi:hypothetical protein